MLSISGPLGLPDYESGEILPSGDCLVVVNATFFSSVSSPYSKTICNEFMCSIILLCVTFLFAKGFFIPLQNSEMCFVSFILVIVFFTLMNQAPLVLTNRDNMKDLLQLQIRTTMFVKAE